MAGPRPLDNPIPSPTKKKKHHKKHTTGKAVPQWLPERQRRNLAKDENYRRRVELIQDLEFPTASQVSADPHTREEVCWVSYGERRDTRTQEEVCGVSYASQTKGRRR